MKKTIITIALCILAANVYAQEEQKSAKDRLSEIEGMADQIIPGKSKSSSDGIFKANALSHFYVGEHILDRNLFPGNRSHEVGLNILERYLGLTSAQEKHQEKQTISNPRRRFHHFPPIPSSSTWDSTESLSSFFPNIVSPIPSRSLR